MGVPWNAGNDPKPSPEELPNARPLMILIVDDEEGFRRWLQWELSSLGMHVETAEDGNQGARMVEQNKFDVVITDISMPEMDGLKLLQEIRRSAPETEVIVATGFGTVETAVHAMQKGAFDFILKPYSLDYLISRLQEAATRLSRCRSCRRFTHE